MPQPTSAGLPKHDDLTEVVSTVPRDVDQRIRDVVVGDRQALEWWVDTAAGSSKPPALL